MNIAFRCRLQYNSDIAKIRKFFEDTDTLHIGAGRAGIALYDITGQGVCYNMAQIHSYDIYRLHVDTSHAEWKNGGILRALPAAPFIAFIKFKEVDDDLQIEIDKDATELTLSILAGDNLVRDAKISLTIPDTAYEYPIMTNANIVLKVNEFKKLCSDMSKASNEVRIESQDNAMRLSAGTHKASYGRWEENIPPHVCSVKNAAFLRATRINIGNTKNSLAGIYIKPDYPLMIKVRLGLLDFLIFSKKWVEQ